MKCPMLCYSCISGWLKCSSVALRARVLAFSCCPLCEHCCACQRCASHYDCASPQRGREMYPCPLSLCHAMFCISLSYPSLVAIFSKLKSCKHFSLFSQKRSYSPLTILVAQFYTFSNSAISFLRQGDQS